MDREICEQLYIDEETVRRTRLRFCEGGLENTLTDKPGRGATAKLDEGQEAHLTALACTEAAHWTYALDVGVISATFVFAEPKVGKRHTLVTRRRTKQDFAYAIRYLVDELYPAAVCIDLVLDNLNTHNQWCKSRPATISESKI